MSDLRKLHVFGNFRPSASEKVKAKAEKKRERYEERPGNSLEHLAAIRKLPCCVRGCNQVGGVDPHHLKQGTGERGTSQRSSDRHALPLCRVHHDDVERVGSRNETAWFQEHGVQDPLDLAARLFARSPNAGVMAGVVFAEKGIVRK